MTYADLENYQALERSAIEGSYRGYKIKAMSPPSSGGLTMLQILKMLERFPIGDVAAGYGFGTPNTMTVMARRDAHRVRRPGQLDGRRGLRQRARPRTAERDLRGPARRADHAHHADYTQPGGRSRKPYQTASIDDNKRFASAEIVNGPGETTTHFSVVDKHGNMVSYTNTIESSHGIGVFAGYSKPDGSFKSHGFLLNNELTDFNLAPTTNVITGEPGYNDVQGNKRPRSSMTPAMIFSADGKPLVAYGSPGGSTIINSVLNVTLNLIDHAMTIERCHQSASHVGHKFG